MVASFVISLFSTNDLENNDSTLLQKDEIQSQQSIPGEAVVDS
jgi:hypothetical protein